MFITLKNILLFFVFNYKNNILKMKETYPQAVSISPEGYKMVDYSQIDIEFRRV